MLLDEVTGIICAMLLASLKYSVKNVFKLAGSVNCVRVCMRAGFEYKCIIELSVGVSIRPNGLRFPMGDVIGEFLLPGGRPLGRDGPAVYEEVDIGVVEIGIVDAIGVVTPKVCGPNKGSDVDIFGGGGVAAAKAAFAAAVV